VQKIDPATDRSNSTGVVTNNPIGLLLFAGRLWLYQLDDVMTAVAGPRSSGMQLTLPFRPGAVAITPTGIWATDNCACMRGTIALLDARTHRLIAEQKIGETPVALATAGNVAYVATFNDGTLSRVLLSG
jgi:DNA-binding beta-propeller fold protein YncE